MTKLLVPRSLNLAGFKNLRGLRAIEFKEYEKNTAFYTSGRHNLVGV